MTDVETYKGCLSNGFKFNCGNLSERTSRDSGVFVIGKLYNMLQILDHIGYVIFVYKFCEYIIVGSSYKESYGNYYGRLLEVLKLHYHNGYDVVLFKCHWFDHTRHVRVDRNRMTTVDVRSRLNAEDVFVLASQAHQVCYVPNIANVKSPWYTVLKTKSRQVGNVEYIDEETSNDAAF